MPRRRKLVDKRPELLNLAWVADSLLLVERDQAGDVHIRRERAPYVCFVKKDEVCDSFLRAVNSDSRVREVREVGAYYRVSWCDRNTCLQMCDALKVKRVPTYEGDVNPVRRWMTDHKPRLGKHRIAFLDIEVDSRLPIVKQIEGRSRILTWSVVATDGTVKVGVLAEDTDKAEAEMLARLLTVLQDFDLIAAWNGDRYDFPVLEARIAKRNLPFVKARWLWLDQMVLFQRMNMMAAESGAEKQSYALQAIATALLGEGKDDFDASQTWQAWSAGGDERRRMVRYCVKDTDLLRRIEEKTGYIGLLQTLAETCNVFPDSRGANPTIQAEGFLLALGAAQDYRFPTARISKSHDPYKGAYVMEPQCSGITKNVHVADFSSLYPSIIVTWNMSPETLVVGRDEQELDAAYHQGAVPWEDGYARAPITGKFFRTDREGILAHAVKEVMRLRKYWNDLKSSLPPGTPAWVEANRKATAYKIAANSFYGVIGSPMSRFFSRDVAESVTQAGAWLIKETIKAAVARGMVAVYGDTDSVFIAGSNWTEFEVFVQWCNDELYPQALRAMGCKENLIHLAYEKEFERVIFTTAKRYCGRYVHFKGTPATEDSKPEVKGLEYKRGDAIRLARQLQAQVVDALMGGGVVREKSNHECIEDPDFFVAMLNEWQQRVLHGELELDDVVIAKRLNKELGDYVQRVKKDGSNARQLPHIEVAKKLKARGYDMGEGAKVRYYIADAKAAGGALYKSEDEWDGNCDRFEVWDKMVFPPTQRLLAAAFPAADWSLWKKTRPRKTRAKKTAVRAGG